MKCWNSLFIEIFKNLLLFNYLNTIYVIELCNSIAFHDFSWNISFYLNKKFIVSKDSKGQLFYCLALISYAWLENNFLHFDSVTDWSMSSANKVTRSDWIGNVGYHIARFDLPLTHYNWFDSISVLGPILFSYKPDQSNNWLVGVFNSLLNQ